MIMLVVGVVNLLSFLLIMRMIRLFWLLVMLFWMDGMDFSMCKRVWVMVDGSSLNLSFSKIMLVDGVLSLCFWRLVIVIMMLVVGDCLSYNRLMVVGMFLFFCLMIMLVGGKSFSFLFVFLGVRFLILVDGIFNFNLLVMVMLVVGIILIYSLFIFNVCNLLFIWYIFFDNLGFSFNFG